jgi:PAS domain S-box-containing protein
VGHTAVSSIRVDELIGTSGDFARLQTELRLIRLAVESTDSGVIFTTQPAESGLWPSMLYVNPAFTPLTGLTPGDLVEPMTGAAPASGRPSQNDPVWKTVLESHHNEGIFSTNVAVKKTSGGDVMLHVRSVPLRNPSGQITHRVAIFRDITQQASLEEVARRNERLACVGLLAAGIAHEINNPTGAALLAAETALAIMDSPQAGPQVAACLQNIIKSMDRCGQIVRTLLRYSRDEPTEKQACSINDVAKQALDLAGPYVEGHGAELRLELAPEAPLAPMNPLEIELVVVNLIRNAVEAGDGKVIVTIRTQRTADSVRVVVGDSGCGMTPEQLAHVFDPLYTTRRQLGGSGLGMSIAYGIIQGHDGQMEVQSKPGIGTTVIIDLPVTARREEGTGPLSAVQSTEPRRSTDGPHPDCGGQPVVR